jgi:hypothetical protein
LAKIFIINSPIEKTSHSLSLFQQMRQNGVMSKQIGENHHKYDKQQLTENYIMLNEQQSTKHKAKIIFVSFITLSGQMKKLLMPQQQKQFQKVLARTEFSML